MANDRPGLDNFCTLQIQVRAGGEDGSPGSTGDLFEMPLKDAADVAGVETTEDTESVDQWKEVERTVEEVDETIDNETVTIRRIIKSKFEKPSGKQVELVFAEAQDDVSADNITEVV